MVGPIRTPLLTAIYALIGAGAAALWVAVPFGWLAVLIVTGIAVGVAVRLERSADSKVTSQPTAARQYYEAKAVVIGLVSALAGGLAVLITIWAATWFADVPTDQEKLIAAVSAALTSLISGVFVSVKETDEAVGNHVRNEFRERWKSRNLPQEVAWAIFSDNEQGYVTWSKEGRKLRVDVVQKWLDAGSPADHDWTPASSAPPPKATT